MEHFLDRLYERHRVRPNVSGRGQRPEFDGDKGAWKSAAKAQHALLLLEETPDGHLRCSIPTYPQDRFRLGQINFTSLQKSAVVAFRLWCAAKRNNETNWQMLPDVSWYIAFRLHSGYVDKIRRTFEGHSLSAIEFRFDPVTGDLAAYTQKQTILCAYLQAGLLLNNDDQEAIGFKAYRYEDATAAIQNGLQIRPFTISSAESG